MSSTSARPTCSMIIVNKSHAAACEKNPRHRVMRVCMALLCVRGNGEDGDGVAHLDTVRIHGDGNVDHGVLNLLAIFTIHAPQLDFVFTHRSENYQPHVLIVEL
eukprot:3767644-Rhodomonas_salina.1